MTTPTDDEKFSFDPLKAIQQFKKGTTPLEAVEYLNVGREVWHDGTLWYLDTFVAGDRSAVRFVKGAYGAGKTHLLYLTAKAALDRNFVVSYVTAEDAPLSKFDVVYRDLVSSLRTRAMVETEGLDFAETTNGFKRILDDWFRATKINAEAIVEDRHVQVAKVNQHIREAIKQIDAPKRWDANFRHAVQHYLLNMLSGTAEGDEENNTILRWLQGETLPKAEMKPFEVYDSIKLINSRDMFRSLVQMLREFGFAGLVVLIDELERILEQAPKARDKAYQTIRQLLDNSDSAGTQSSYVLCAITPEVLSSEKGFKAYDALWERVKTELGTSSSLIDKRAIVMDLELTPFDHNELVAMGRKIRAVHAAAMGWNASERVPNEAIDAYVNRLSQAELEISKPRVLVRTVTQVLEKAEQYPNYDPIGDVTGEITESVRALQEERSQETWDAW
jgi:hypothetical protein